MLGRTGSLIRMTSKANVNVFRNVMHYYASKFKIHGLCMKYM